MKKILLTLTGAFAIALGSLQAQQRTDPEQSSPQYKNDQQESRDYSTGWRNEDRENITREQLPSGLLETLKSEAYQGWENATIYHNKVSDDYMLIIQDNGSPKTFYFDSEGQAFDYSSEQTDVSAPKESSNNNMNQQQQDVNRDQSMNQDQSQQDDSEIQSGAPNGVSADDSSAGTTTPTGTTQTEAEVQIQTTPPQPPSASWKSEDRIIIVADEIPQSLRVTLEGDEYTGWENSTLYRNRSTNEYMIEIRDGSNTKVYYFDKDGKVISNSGNND